ncbi:hypothetical protein TSAR_012996 [Trichomalopsis sarcophagae]|uniref:Gustatory receptor n=1 Tax=Trichomalopsis sarcophagae TaxID=543379 RepID=A0A232F9I4_9HYME|nr:hypothetical protein TSAR_012996 [Trichomalopsis sarcophagae]
MFRTRNNKINPKKGRPVLNIADSFRPFVWINGLMGFGMIEMPYGRPWPKLSIFYGLLRAIVFSILSWYVFKNIASNTRISALMFLIYKIIIAASVGAVVISSIMGLINHEKSKKLYKKIKLVDETLKMFGVESEYASDLRRNRNIIINYYRAIIVLFIIKLGSSYIFSRKAFCTRNILNVLYFNIPSSINPLVDINYTSKIRVLEKRFERLNALIHNVTTSPSKMMHIDDFKKYEMILNNRGVISVIPNYCFKNRNNIEHLLKVSRQLHLDLCNIARNMNNLIYTQMSAQLSAIFVHLTASTYCFYFIFNEKAIPLQAKMHSYVLLISSIICGIVRIILITYATAGKISKILHEIQIQNAENKLTNEIHQFCMQLKQHPLSFIVCGFVELNFSYVTGFVGAVTTYLMILIQNQTDMIEAIKSN